MSKKLIFLDIDGTLTVAGTNEPPKSAIVAIEKARAKGHKVYLCTGRNYAMVKPLLRYSFDGYIASAGGYIVYDNQVIFDCPMDEEVKEKALHLLKKNNIHRTIECLNESYTDEGYEELLKDGQEGNSELIRLRRQIESALDIRPYGQYKNQPLYKILFMCNSMKQLEEPMRELGEYFHFVVQEKNEQGIINGELINRRFDKGRAVERVCQHSGISIENTIGFGDSLNDLEMIESVGYGVCMANGSNRIKQIADYVCPSVEADGLLHSFEKLNLI